jgi:hypothetical protein
VAAQTLQLDSAQIDAFAERMVRSMATVGLNLTISSIGVLLIHCIKASSHENQNCGRPPGAFTDAISTTHFMSVS